MHNPPKQDASRNLDLSRLAKLCELLTSPHAAERAMAADKSSAMLVAADMTWTELIFRGQKSASEAHYTSSTSAYSKSSMKDGVYAALTRFMS
jgi:hypothetical protein